MKHTITLSEGLGNVLIVREYGIEVFKPALDKSKSRLQTLVTTPRKIMSLRQAEYLLKRRARDGRLSVPDKRPNQTT